MRIVQDERDVALNPGQAIGVVGDVLRERSSGSIPALARGAYQLRLAESREDREAAFRLRFLVFNLELNEGLECAYEAGYDTDEFDKTCDHLIVEHRPSQQVVGTYRLQTGRVAGSPRPGFTIPISAAIPETPRINPPRLLRAYLSIGAQICGEPAMDREFKTIDFLTLLDLTKLCSSARFRFLRNE